MSTATHFVASPLSSVMLLMIEAYQRFISPYKGFRCAYRAARGRHSCSEFGKRALRRGGVLGFWPLLRRRFARCAEAARSLKAKKSAAVLDYESKQNRKDEEESSRRRSHDRSCDSGADCLPHCGEVGSCDVGDAGCGSTADVAGSVGDGCSVGADACPADACPSL
jgi:putative component of membrane protein insertase Oxa1/YidC/SpoIIIJ protein YidD